MITLNEAHTLVEEYLCDLEKDLNKSGGDFDLTISVENEYDFGWIFSWCDRRYLESNDTKYALFGGGPLIADRFSGQLYTTGSAYSESYYAARYRAGDLQMIHPYSPLSKNDG